MKRNAFFQLIHKKDGLYLKSYPAIDGGKELQMDDIMKYLSSKKQDEVSFDMIKDFITKASKEKNAEIKISDNEVLPENETAIIMIDPKRLYAKVRLYPNSNLGSRITSEELIDLLGQKGVKYGIIQKNIDIMLRARLYCTDILVAKAKMPIHGKDAVITYHFDVNKTNKPAMDENGQVDYHKLDMIEAVSEGQLLATLEPADFGTEGIDVTGGVIKPKTVAIKKLKHGKNIHLSEDELEMYSDVSGNVTCVDDMVFVSDCYEVPADVGPSTGDIEYDGSINIKGNVLSGYSVTASGDIYVNGAVEGSYLTAGGKIVLNRGIQGMGKGILEAKGDIISNFIESSTVHSEGNIISDAIMHSEVVAGDKVEANGKRGMIAGGKIRAKELIETKIAGSTMGTTTELEVGIDPKIIERFHQLENMIEELSDEKEKVEQNIIVLQKRYKLKGSLEPEKIQKLKGYSNRLEEIEEEEKKNTEEYELLEEELESGKNKGKIVVNDIAYTGVKLTIANSTKFLHSEVQHSSFVREGADIRIKGI